MTIAILSPTKYADYQGFCEFVEAELGDIPVLDEGEFISPKIRYYWAAWRSRRDVRLFSLGELWDGMLWAKAYWSYLVKLEHQR